MKVNFYLKNKTTDGRYSVVLIANVNYQRYRYSTNIKVFPREWDAKRQIIKAKSSASVLNDKLNQIANYATEYLDNLPLGEKPTQQSFKYHMDLATGKKQPDDNSFFGFINRFCLTANKRMNPQGTECRRNFFRRMAEKIFLGKWHKKRRKTPFYGGLRLAFLAVSHTAKNVIS